jgi:uncharacterized membrane protein
MSDPSARTFSADFKRFFLRGLAILLPSVLTLWIVVKAYQFIDNAVAEPINSSVRAGMASLTPYWAPLQNQFEPNDAEVSVALASANVKTTPDAMRAKLRYEHIATWWAERWYMDFIGLVIAIIAVYIAGRLLGGIIGRGFYRRIERLITSVPVFKQVYPYVKQVVDFLISDDKQLKFNRVVMAQYPRQGIWSIGFLTGSAMDSVKERAGDSVTVFIPSSPTPFTGYAINVPRSEVVELPITVEEAVRFVVSCGVLVPQHQRPPVVPETLRAIDMATTEEFAISVAARVKTTLTHPDLGER